LGTTYNILIFNKYILILSSYLLLDDIQINYQQRIFKIINCNEIKDIIEIIQPFILYIYTV